MSDIWLMADGKWLLRSNVRADLPVEAMNLTPQALQHVAIVRRDRGVALFLQRLHLRLDRRLVDADDGVMLVRVNAERLAQRREQVLLVQLRVALDRFLVLD